MRRFLRTSDTTIRVINPGPGPKEDKDPFKGLPQDIWDLIIRHLSLEDLFTISVLSKRHRQIIKTCLNRIFLQPQLCMQILFSMNYDQAEEFLAYYRNTEAYKETKEKITRGTATDLDHIWFALCRHGQDTQYINYFKLMDAIINCDNQLTNDTKVQLAIILFFGKGKEIFTHQNPDAIIKYLILLVAVVRNIITVDTPLFKKFGLFADELTERLTHKLNTNGALVATLPNLCQDLLKRIEPYFVRIFRMLLIYRDFDLYLNLSGMDFGSKHFSHIKLNHADLSASNLSQVRFTFCDLSDALLDGTKLGEENTDHFLHTTILDGNMIRDEILLKSTLNLFHHWNLHHSFRFIEALIEQIQAELTDNPPANLLRILDLVIEHPLFNSNEAINPERFQAACALRDRLQSRLEEKSSHEEKRFVLK